MKVYRRIRCAIDIGLECTSWADQLLHVEAEAALSCKLRDCTKLLDAEVPVAKPMSEPLDPVSDSRAKSEGRGYTATANKEKAL